MTSADTQSCTAKMAEPVGEGMTDDIGKVWQWYTYCPEEGIELYSSREQAQSATQSIMGSYAVAAHSDGWHEDMELVSWGMLVPVERAQVVARETAEPSNEFDEWVKYELRPARAALAGPVTKTLGPTRRQLMMLAEDMGMASVSEATEYARAVLARFGYQPAPPADVTPGPSIEAVGSLIAWLTEQACRAADADQPTDAGMLTWAAQVIGEQVDEDAPALPAAGEVAELAAWLRGCADDHYGHGRSQFTRAADLLERLASPACVVLKPSPELIEAFKDALPGRIEPLPDDTQAIEPTKHTILVPVPAPVPVTERLPGPGDCDAEGRCWWFNPGQPAMSNPHIATSSWRLCRMLNGKPMGSQWLPATALSVPGQGEI